jgi:phosphoenolpyruvate carboxykinase (ATP)
MNIAHTRALIQAVLDGSLANIPMRRDELFNLSVPVSCPNVPHALLDPRTTWSDPAAYDRQAARLSEMFHKNFERFAGQVPPEIAAAGPQPQLVVA